MNASKPILALTVALGMLAAGPVAAASDHQNEHNSSAVRHAARAPKPTAAAVSNPKPDVNAPAGAAYGSATDPQIALDALAVQHKDKGWKSNHESWCDVDPNCNGWNKNMQTYEQIPK
jgi:hypothetical protein